MAIKVQGTTVIDDNRNLQNTVNLNATGNVYANTFIGDGSQLTSLPPSGGSHTAVASGALSDGSTVVINSDGTVSVVDAAATPTSVGTSVNVDSTSDINTGSQNMVAAAFDANSGKLVVAFSRESPDYSMHAAVGTVTGTSISFGSTVAVQPSHAQVNDVSMTYDSDSQKIVIIWRGDTSSSRNGKAIVGTVSGTSISFGSAVTYDTGLGNASVAYDSSNQKIVIAFEDDGNSNYGTAIVGTVSGTSISFGSKTVFYSAYINSTRIAYDANAQKVVVVYLRGNNGKAIVGTVSGTSISFGSEAALPSAGNMNFPNVAYDPVTTKIIAAWYNSGTAGYAAVGTVSGTSISFGSATSYFSDPFGTALGISDTGTIVVAYRRFSPNGIEAKIATVSGTSISFGSATTVVSHNNGHIIAAAMSGERFAFAHTNDDDNDRPAAVVLQTPATNLTSSNYIGISNGAYANGATATVQLISSVDDAQSGLTPGERYYVLANGSISTTAGIPSVIAGLAVSSTKLAVKG